MLASHRCGHNDAPWRLIPHRDEPLSFGHAIPEKLSASSKQAAEAAGYRPGGYPMLRKLLLPLAAAGLLGGCVTGDYAYRGGPGDYYYGRPQVEYRYHGGPYGYHPYAPYSRFGFYGHYGRPFYGHPYYGYPFWGYRHHGHPHYYRPPVVVQPRPDGGVVQDDRSDRPPPWRDLGARRRAQMPGVGGAMRPPPEPARPSLRGRDDGGSRMEQMLRRGQRDGAPASSVEP